MLAGSAEDDVRHGYAGADVLAGLAGDDQLFGEEGNLNVEHLTLTGTAAIDAGGNDVFDVNGLPESGLSVATRDVITDFARGQDKIDLRTIDANALTSANDAFTGFIASTAAFTRAGQLKFASGVLYGNTDADADAEFSIALTGVRTLGATDILL
jgi:Ca2+-binding RTX toxin-like protein